MHRIIGRWRAIWENILKVWLQLTKPKYLSTTDLLSAIWRCSLQMLYILVWCNSICFFLQVSAMRRGSTLIPCHSEERLCVEVQKLRKHSFLPGNLSQYFPNLNSHCILLAISIETFVFWWFPFFSFKRCIAWYIANPFLAKQLQKYAGSSMHDITLLNIANCWTKILRKLELNYQMNSDDAPVSLIAILRFWWK